MLGFNFDLLDQLTFYGAYHNNKWNQIIHFFFVPMIMWSVLVWMAYTGQLYSSTPLNTIGIELNLSLIFCVIYFGYYLTLDFFAGLSWSICIGLPLQITATSFCQQVEGAWMWALCAHVLGWYAQIHPGHIILEKRRPALLDSFFQSVVLAPLFVWMELLFLFGYKPQLHKELSKRVNTDIQRWRNSQK
eukprot:TRINITY_DN6063_c1_g1_i1.p1 TRINITY_DN6063_c1_g1~~TRINITY_DN6063_c1_g1_i1.p1  ORF type:complete len:200 (-),score=4.20 TRINITY_DN6063_c1_g1_i1:507-1073(-)